MLEKNKDYVEMCVSSTDCAFTQNEPTSICIDGYVYTPYMRLPDPGEFYVVISKEKFEKLQADVNINAELARQWEINYDLLLKKTGFDTVEELVDYIHDNGPIPQMNWETLKQIIDDAEEDYISERDKAEELQKENEQLKKKLEEFSPVPGYSEFLKALYPGEDVEKLVWATEQTCCGRDLRHALQTDLEYYRAISSAQAKSIGGWKKATGCSTPDEAKELIDKLRDDISGHDTVIKSYERNIKKWQKATGCLRPEEISAASIIAKAERLDREVDIYTKALQEWKEGTGCPSPSAAKTLIESGASWRHAYNEIKEANRKLGITIEAWQNVTGYTTPEDYLAANIRTVYAKLEPSDKVWQEFTGCDSPQKAGCKINSLCDDICKLKGDYDNLLKLTGYKSERDIRVVLTLNEQFVYETMRELINSLKRKAKFTDSNWQNATGCKTSEEAETTMRNLRGRIDEMKTFAAIASNWTDRIVED